MSVPDGIELLPEIDQVMRHVTWRELCHTEIVQIMSQFTRE